jgi:hypothetical protein
MRRMLIPLAGLTLLGLVGCQCTMGHCDCEAAGNRAVTCMYDYQGTTNVSTAAAQPPVVPEKVKELPRVAPDK